MYIPDSKILTERVILYNKSLNKKPNADNLSALHNLITNDVRIIIYSFYKDTKMIDEEDASEFLLFMEPKIESIIRNYRNNGTDFKNYIFPILIRKLRTFYKYRSVQSQRERTINNCHTFYEYQLSEEDNSSKVVAEKREYNIFESNELNKLKYLCRNSKTVKKRLFVYLMHLASNLQNYDISNICNEFCFDKNETERIIDRINVLLPENEHANDIRERRNINWIRQLFLQEDLSVRNYLDDYSMNAVYQSRIDHYIDSFNNQTKELSEKRKTISRSFIAKLLGISVANTGAAVYYTKNLLKYCIGENQTAQSMGISGHLFNKMENNSWHFDSLPFDEKPFVPSKEFRLSSDLGICPQVELMEQINYSHYIHI